MQLLSVTAELVHNRKSVWNLSAMLTSIYVIFSTRGGVHPLLAHKLAHLPLLDCGSETVNRWNMFIPYGWRYW